MISRRLPNCRYCLNNLKRSHGEGHSIIPVSVSPKLFVVVNIHLQQIFIEGISATAPADTGICEFAGSYVDTGAHQAIVWLSPVWFGVDKIGLGKLTQRSIFRVTSQVGEASPLAPNFSNADSTIAIKCTYILELGYLRQQDRWTSSHPS